MSVFEILGVITGILAVWLTTRQKIWCWPVGIVSVALFIVVFFRARLYAAMGLQAAYVALAAYGWYAWSHGGDGQGELPVSRVKAREAALLFGIGAASAVGLGWWLQHRTDEALPVLDASTTAFSLVAQWMQARKYLENWVVWIVVDVFYVGMSLSQGLMLTSGLYAIYMALAVLGIREWRASMARSALTATPSSGRP